MQVPLATRSVPERQIMNCPPFAFHSEWSRCSPRLTQCISLVSPRKGGQDYIRVDSLIRAICSHVWEIRVCHPTSLNSHHWRHRNDILQGRIQDFWKVDGWGGVGWGSILGLQAKKRKGGAPGGGPTLGPMLKTLQPGPKKGAGPRVRPCAHLH